MNVDIGPEEDSGRIAHVFIQLELVNMTVSVDIMKELRLFHAYVVVKLSTTYAGLVLSTNQRVLSVVDALYVIGVVMIVRQSSGVIVNIEMHWDFSAVQIIAKLDDVSTSRHN